MASALSSLVASLPTLVGVLVGGALTMIGTVYSTRRTTGATQRAWLRDRREAAYLALLTARKRYAEAQVEKGDAMVAATRAGTARDFDHAPYTARIAEAWEGVEDAAAKIGPFGCAASAKALASWLDVLRTTYGMATRPGVRRRCPGGPEGRGRRQPGAVHPAAPQGAGRSRLRALRRWPPRRLQAVRIRSAIVTARPAGRPTWPKIRAGLVAVPND